MRVTVDRGRCVASGQCVAAAPGVFDQDDAEGLVVLLDPAPGADVRPEVHDAAEGCPARAISVTG